MPDGLRPFADPNLRLAIIDEVYQARVNHYAWLDRVEGLRVRYEAVRGEGPSWEHLGEESELNAPLEALLHSLPVSPEDLERIEALTLDGDRPAYAAIFDSWWDLGDHFVIRDLRGLEALRNLRHLHLGQGLVHGVSLEPLRALERLRRLDLCFTTAPRDLEVLGQLPLDELWLTNLPARPDPDWAVALDRLRERGVRFL